MCVICSGTVGRSIDLGCANPMEQGVHAMHGHEPYGTAGSPCAALPYHYHNKGRHLMEWKLLCTVYMYNNIIRHVRLVLFG